MQSYDIIIIGAGPAGLAAGMYAGRLHLKTIVFGDPIIGGKLSEVEPIENYPGFQKISGAELAEKLKQHCLVYKDFVEIKNERVEKISKDGKSFKLFADKKSYTAKTIIFATGAEERKLLNAKGEEKFLKKGIHFCGLCDGPFYKGKIVAVIGGSDSAAKEALLLTQWAKKVYIIYRRESLRAEPVNLASIEKKIKEGKIEIIYKTNILEFRGDKFLRTIILDNPYKGSKEFPIDGVFLSVGAAPQSKLAEELGAKVNEKKEIIINRNSETNLPGIFAAGDVCDTRFKQAITGVSEAVNAVYSAYLYLRAM